VRQSATRVETGDWGNHLFETDSKRKDRGQKKNPRDGAPLIVLFSLYQYARPRRLQFFKGSISRQTGRGDEKRGGDERYSLMTLRLEVTGGGT